MTVLVAVCTNRTPKEVKDTLAALGPQLGADVRGVVVTSGLGASEHAAHAQQAERHGLSAIAAEAGLSTARNAALHEAGGARAVAYLDDDAYPAPEWAERLSAHWDAAGVGVGCIGGRILPRWSSPPPSWMSPSLFSALSLLDLGPGVRELDPGRTDAYGANISFDVTALRRAGGFDPSFGPWRRVPLFGDESMVQRRLVELGYGVLYAGDVVVEHLVSAERLTVRGIARRRFWFGAVSASPETATPVAGAGRAIRAATGALLARARRRDALTAERQVRAAQNAGVALGPVLRARLRRRGWPGGR